MGPGSIIRNGEIKLLSRLGVGGFGEVFLAQTKDGLKAVKIVDTSGWSKSEYQVFNTMLMNEASFMRTLEHKTLPRSYGFFAEGSRYFLIMDWIQGHTLEEEVERNGPLGLDELLALSGTLIEVLVYLHRRCVGVVVFGDLKPANVLKTGAGKYRLVDLGLVSKEGTLFSKQIAVFSPKYGAPERARGGASNPLHDIFSLGATLFYALTGEDPVSGLSDGQRQRLISKRLSGGKKTWGEASLHTMAQLLTLALAALDSEPEGRPASIEVFRQAWERCRRVRSDEVKSQESGSVDQIVRLLYDKK